MMTICREDIIDFLYTEARMLDENRHSEWIDLWADDGYYWMPLEPMHGDKQEREPHLVTSLLYEDLFMLKLRVERLKGERTFSQRPRSRCHHVLQRPFIDEFDIDNGRIVTNTNMHYVETRLDEQFLLALTVSHELKLVDGHIRIANKRVDIVNSDAAFGNNQLLP